MSETVTNKFGDLSEILKMLKECVTGHVGAYKDLLSKSGPNKLERLYSQFAQEEWNKVHEADPDDWVACHHLAIMYHAKAFDLEAEGKTEDAREHWKLAHKFWNKLFRLRQPVKTIHSFVKKMDGYKEDKHGDSFKRLEKRLVRDLLEVHRKLFEYYANVTQHEDRAECHYSILETSPFVEKNTILREIYEKKFGDHVRKITSELKKYNSEKKRLKSTSEIENLYERINLFSHKRKSQSALLRDLLILESWNLRMGVYRWRERVDEFEKKMKQKIKRFNKLKNELKHTGSLCESYAPRAELGELTESEIRIYKDTIAKHNGMVEEQDEIRKEYLKGRKEVDLSLGNLTRYTESSIKLLSDLSFQNSAEDMRDALIEFQESLDEVLRKFPSKDNFKDNPEASMFIQKIVESQQLAGSYFNGINSAVSSEALQHEKGKAIWHWENVKKEDTPYRNTCFVLLDEELPSGLDTMDAKKQINKLIIKRQNLERRARANKHIVFGKTIKRQMLNLVEERLKDPVSLAGDMILQHQAHHADLNEVREKLAGIDMPAHEGISFELAPSLFRLLRRPSFSDNLTRKWKKPDKEEACLKELDIKWPV